MASSGVVTYRPTANTAINQALLMVGAIDPENNNTPTANQTANALTAGNMLLKTWETNGLQLWERRWAVVFPQETQGLFVLGSPGPAGDHACLSTPMNGGFVQTTLSAAAASGASTISVTSVTGQLSTAGNTAVSITNAYNIGIQLDDGTLQWTTVNGAPSGTTVTLAATLTGAAASGNYVYCYQTKLIRPLRVIDGFVRHVAGGNDTPIRTISRQEYMRFGNKSSQGTPTQIYYDPQTNVGNLYVYPTFSSVAQLLFVDIQRPIEDLATASDDFDLPQEWAEALTYNIAWRLAPAYTLPSSTYKQIKELAIFTFDKLNTWDQEMASMFLQPNTEN